MNKKFQLNKTSLAKYSWSGSGNVGGLDDGARTGRCASRRQTYCTECVVCTGDANNNGTCDDAESGSCPVSVTFCF